MTYNLKLPSLITLGPALIIPTVQRRRVAIIRVRNERIFAHRYGK